MINHTQDDLSGFFVAGISYKKADAVLRSSYAVNDTQYDRILNRAKSAGFADLFILSTCNRTEIFGFADNASQLIALLCSETRGDLAGFTAIAYVKQGVEAIHHLFRVGAGLDSQIVGDYEIIAQVKLAVKFAEERSCISPFMNRLIGYVIKNSKDIKNKTSLSEGTSSVSFAAIKCIRKLFPDTGNFKLAVIGTGKIGKTICRNLVHYLHTREITLVNRSDAKALELAQELNILYKPYSELEEVIAVSDIILVATSSPEPLVTRQQLGNKGKKLIIDLSIPYNVEPAVKNLPGITLVNVDELSGLQDDTLRKRQEQVLPARKITEENIREFLTWAESRRRLIVLGNIKSTLQEIQTSRQCTQPLPQKTTGAENSHHQIQRILNGTAIKMKSANQQGCIYISAINEFMLAIAN